MEVPAALAVAIVVPSVAALGFVFGVKAKTDSLEERADKTDATIAEHKKDANARIDKTEACMDKLELDLKTLPKDYVPRSEVERALSGIENTVRQTNALVQAMVYSGGDRDTARKAVGQG